MGLAIQSDLAPDRPTMVQHLEHLFGGWLDGAQDGLIEIAWTVTVADQNGKYALRYAQLFGTDHLEEAANRAIEVNSNQMCNVYVGGALRKPDTTPFDRAHDVDVMASLALWCDLDSADAVAAALPNYLAAKPTLLVNTGDHPHKRLQCWWRLSERIDSQERLRNALMGLACKMQGDTTVTNPSRVMRLAGSIAWPQKPGRIAELTSIIPFREPGPPEYLPEHLESVYPPVTSIAAARERRDPDGGDGSIVRAKVLGMSTGKVIDGREAYMVKVILATLIELVGTTGAEPSVEDLINVGWPIYQRTTDFSRPGRGESEFRQKCIYTARRFAQGQIPRLRGLDDAVAAWQRRSAAKSAYTPLAKENDEPKWEPPQILAPDPSKPLILTASQFVAGFTPPEYLIDGILQRGYLYSLTARTSHGKTVVSMYLAQAVARGTQFHGRKVLRGSVLFLAGENPDDIRARYLVLANKHGFDPATCPIHFIAGVVDLAAAMPRIQQDAATIADLRLVVVDTAAAYYLGDDANSNAQQGAYARLLRQLTFLPGLPATVVNSHPIKNAPRDSLLPVGGGAFVNEVDGNLTLWSDAEMQTELHWQGKFRGPEFEPLIFKMETVTCDAVKDAEGRLMPSVVAMPMGDMEISFREKETEASDNQVMLCIARNKKISQADIAIKLGWVMADGKPYKMKVRRAMDRLRSDKLIEQAPRRKAKITKAGKQELGIDQENDD